MSTCRSCGAEIIWAVMGSGKRMPFDAEPVIPSPTGLFVVITDDEGVHGLSQNNPLYRSHFATCPNAAEHRR